MVSYNVKHNEVNGEDNRDGDNNNLSYNHGVEGATRHKGIERVRVRQLKNMLSTLMLSQGVPMMLSGDECRRTQHGNNNAYCQDNEISWFNWSLVKENSELLRFVRELIRFRRSQPTLRRKGFFSGRPTRSGLSDVNWYSALGTAIDWANDDRCMIILLTAPTPDEDDTGLGRDILVMVNNSHESQPFIIPPIAKSSHWRLVVDTAAPSPRDTFADGDGPPLSKTGSIRMMERSLRCYAADL